MKKTIALSGLLAAIGSFGAFAQQPSVGQALKNKKDSIQYATVNNAVNDPIGSASKVIGLFRRKSNAQTTVAPGATTALPATAPAASPMVNPVAVNTTTTPIAPVNSPATVNNTGLISGMSKSINNGLTFSIVQCTGDRASQVITIGFAISNPNKVNQAVIVGSFSSYSYDNPGFAIDANGNKLPVGNISFGNKTAAHVASELPTGISAQGTITLINALPTSSTLQYLKIPVGSQNLAGAGDRQGTVIEERNIPVAWAN